MKDILVLFDIDYTLFDTATFKNSGLSLYTLYPQVKKVLEELSNKFTLGILSQGETDFQIKKLKETGIFELFDKNHLFITRDKHGEMEGILKRLQMEKAIFVEDKPEILKKAKGLDPHMVTVWVKNGPFAAASKADFQPDYVVDSVLEIPTLLDGLFPSS